MPWNGSGVFSRVYSWAADRDNGLDILADRMDTDTDDITAGLMHCLTVDGQTVPTANLPMAGYRHTGAAAGVAASDYVTVGQLTGGGAVPAGGFLPLAGGTVTGALTVNGTLTAAGAASVGNVLSVGGYGINYASYYSGHHIAFGWDGTHLQTYVDNSGLGPVVFSNFPGNITASGYTITAAQLTSTANINAAGTVTAAQLTSTGNINASGAIAANGNINASGAIAATGNISGGSLSVAGLGTWSNYSGWMFCNVGIATAANLDINGLVWQNSSGWMDTSSGVQAGGLQINGNATVTGNLAVSGSSGLEAVTATNISANGTVTATGNITAQGGVVYAGGYYMQGQSDRIYFNGNMQMAGGTFWKPGGGGFQDPSDIRLKKDVTRYRGGLDQILRLEPVEFCYNGRGGMIADGRRYVGLIANDVAPVMPEMVLPWRPAEPAPDDEDDLLGLDAAPLTLALINAIKTLSARLLALEGRG